LTRLDLQTKLAIHLKLFLNEADKGTPGAILGRKAKVFGNDQRRAMNDIIELTFIIRASFLKNVWLPKRS
jgi:hypothetical protein